jgi:hypothetical protein
MFLHHGTDFLWFVCSFETFSGSNDISNRFSVPRIRMPQRRWTLVLTTNGRRRFAFLPFDEIKLLLEFELRVLARA